MRHVWLHAVFDLDLDNTAHAAQSVEAAYFNATLALCTHRRGAARALGVLFKNAYYDQLMGDLQPNLKPHPAGGKTHVKVGISFYHQCKGTEASVQAESKSTQAALASHPAF